MKNTHLFVFLLLIAASFAACKKDDSIAAPSATCTIIINDTLSITPDSVHYDYFNGTLPRIQAFKNTEATFTLWPGSFATGSVSLRRQYVYWIYKTGIYSPLDAAPGLLQLTNNSDVLSGSFNASGTIYSGTGSINGKVAVVFANVRKPGQ